MTLKDIYNKKGSVSDYVDQVLHNQLLEKYVFKKNVFLKQLQAQRLEYYFNLIVTYVKTTQPVPGTNSFINELLARGLPSDLFNYTNKNDSKAGFEFEKDLAKIIAAAFGTGLNENAIKKITIGNTKTTVGLNFSEEFLDKKLKAKSVTINENVGAYLQKKFNNQIHTLKNVQGKIDIRVPSLIKAELTSSSSLNEFIQLLAGANITAKNYTSMTHINLGHASRIRQISSVLEDLGYDEQSIQTIYNSIIKARGQSKLNQHKYHINFAYELGGMGQYYNIHGGLEKIGSTDFLIVYNKSKNQIKVRSVADLIYKALTNTKTSSHAYISLI